MLCCEIRKKEGDRPIQCLNLAFYVTDYNQSHCGPLPHQFVQNSYEKMCHVLINRVEINSSWSSNRIYTVRRMCLLDLTLNHNSLVVTWRLQENLTQYHTDTPSMLHLQTTTIYLCKKKKKNWIHFNRKGTFCPVKEFQFWSQYKSSVFSFFKPFPPRELHPTILPVEMYLLPL